MVRLSERTIKLLKEDILAILYERPLVPLFTYRISQELRRDNEFTKKLLLLLKKDGFVEEIAQGKKGNFLARRKWKIPNQILKSMREQINK